MTNTYYFKLMKSVKLQENNVRIGLAKGKWTFPEDWETKDKALDKEIEDDFFECGITNVHQCLRRSREKDGMSSSRITHVPTLTLTVPSRKTRNLLD